MELTNTKEYIYKKCADRIRNRIKDREVSHYDIYPGDEKIISRIINCNTNKKKNPYLIQDAVLDGYHKTGKDDYGRDIYEHVGIIPILKFNNKQSVLWGTPYEIEESLAGIFRALIYDLIDNRIDTYLNVEDILCDHVKYSKYYTYWQLLFNSNNTVPAFYYGIFEDEIIENIDSARDCAIDYLYSKPNLKGSFHNAFMKFTSNTDSFSYLDKTIFDKLLYPYVIPLLQQYIPSADSLGLRVRDIILGDLSQTRALIFIPQNYNSICERLILTSSKYIKQLEDLQNEYIAKSKIK